MGRDKATLSLDGSPLARRVAAALVAGGTRWPVVVGGDRAQLEALGFVVVPDRWPGEGPLGGIATALEWAATDVVVVACDLPWLTGAAVAAVVGPAAGDGEPVDVTVAVTDRLEPLLSRWSIAALPVLEQALADGERAVHRVLGAGRLRVRHAAVDPAALRNVNTPADLVHGGHAGTG